MIIYDFDALESLLRIVKSSKLQSRLYREIPTTVGGLVMERIHDNKSEIKQLCLLPLIDYLSEKPLVDKYFISDMTLILKYNNQK